MKNNPKKIIYNISQMFAGLFFWDSTESSTRGRLIVIICLFCSGFIIVAIKLFIVSSGEYIGKKLLTNNEQNYHRYDIVDRNDNLLAVNLPIASLFANPKRVVDPEDATEKLIKIFPDLDKKHILNCLKSDKTFVWIKRDITPKEQEDIYNFGMPGFEFEKEQKRVYIYGNLLSHLIGYVDRDMNGLAGIEKYFNRTLKGDELGYDLENGGNIKLSIDIRIQNIVSQELDKTIKKFNAKGGACVVADPTNGEILALVSKPDFDPHHPGKANEDQLFNIASQGVYEMGSGMKALTMAIGFDINAITMHDVYDLSFMKVNGFQVKDYTPSKGWNTVPEIFLKSSNVGVSQIILEIGRNNLREYLKKLNLLDKLSIEIPEKGRPLFQNYSAWTDLSLVTMSYGYGISESPAHFVQSMVPAMNGGILYNLTLLKRKNGEVLEGTRVFKKETSDNMRKLMRIVVTDGTGKKAEVKGYYVGGKTGTAHKAFAGKYDKDKRISSFFGVMPATNPKYIAYVIIDEPKGIKESYGFAGGGWTAAPTIGAIFEKISTLYALPKIDPNSKEAQEITNFEYRISNET